MAGTYDGGRWLLFEAALVLSGAVLGFGLHAAWQRRDEHGDDAMSEVRRMRRRDRVRESVVLANENLYQDNVGRALKWARRAVRLDGREPRAHAVLGSCYQALDHFGRAIMHHRRAEQVATDVGALKTGGTWRLQNALDAVQCCKFLHAEASESEAQVLFDEAAAWARLAYKIDAEEASETLALSPWLANLTGGEACLP